MSSVTTTSFDDDDEFRRRDGLGDWRCERTDVGSVPVARVVDADVMAKIARHAWHLPASTETLGGSKRWHRRGQGTVLDRKNPWETRKD